MRIVSSLIISALLALSPGAGAEVIAPVAVERGAGAERCPDAEFIGARVEQIRGRPAVGLAAPYRVTFERKEEGFVATIRSEGGAGGVRTLEHDGPQCGALGNAVVVTLALLFDAEIAPKKSEPPPAPVTPAAPPPPPIAPPEAPIVRDVTISLGAAALAGVFRPVSPAALGELGVRWGALRGSAGVIFAWPADVSLGPGKVKQRMAGGLARFCFAPWENGALRFDACS
ncbi:MAG: hypothetical protein ABW133_07805, partial [Polyangiaceae bacterium]